MKRNLRDAIAGYMPTGTVAGPAVAMVLMNAFGAAWSPALRMLLILRAPALAFNGRAVC